MNCLKRECHTLLLLFALVALLLTGCSEQNLAPATSAETAVKKIYNWKLAMTWPTNFPIFSSAVNSVAEKVKTMSNGELVITIDSANKHKAPLGILDMVNAGQYQMGHSASYYWKGKDASTMFFTTMPFGMTATEQYAWFYYGGGMELMQQVYARHGVYSFPGGNTGVQMGGWFREEIKTLDDLKGLKMRIPGFAGEILSQLGVVVTNIPPGELYTALDRGTIDALEWVGPALDLNMGFQKIAPYYYTGWHEPASELQFLVNRKAFDELPQHLQEILVTAMKAETLDAYARMFYDNAINFASIQSDYPEVKVKTFSGEILAAMKAANQRLLEATAANDPQFKAILDSQRAYLTKARPWSIASDFAYLKDNQ
ncbi:MAG: TRAP transporter substrate-binding protein [Desulfuromonadales bacterium]|nr:TRAP transporter substrate-binding protein [Desulfuromonadales bacterium]